MPAAAAISSMPTPAPCRPTAASAASTSCSRRARRCSSHRESRRSRRSGRVRSRGAAPARGGSDASLGLRRASHRLGFHVTERYLILVGTGHSHPTPEVPMAPRHRPQGRDRRRQPHPVRPLERRLRAGVQPGHAHRHARRAGRPVRPAGRAGRRGGRRRRAQARPRLQPHPRVRARLDAVGHAPPPTTSSRPAAPASRRPSSSPTRSPSARSSPASPAASTPPPTPRSPSTTTCAACSSALNSAKTLQQRLKALARAPARASSCPEIPRNAEPRTGLSMGEHAAHHRHGVGDRPRGAGRAHRPLAPEPRRRLRPRLLRRPGHAVPRPHPRPEPAPGHLAGEAREAQAGLRQGRGRAR